MTPLSSQERKALLLTAQGYTDNNAAERYGKSPRTFRRDLASAQAKLGARSRLNAVAIAATLRIIAVVPPSGGPR